MSENIRFATDYLCKSNSEINSHTLHCRKRILQEIAEDLGIDIRAFPERTGLCTEIQKVILSNDLTLILDQCRLSITRLQVLAIQSAVLDLVSAELAQLVEWHNDMQNAFADLLDDQSITDSRRLQKLQELRNQVKGSCDTFTRELTKRVSNVGSGKNKSKSKTKKNKSKNKGKNK